jgi:hypothetical protein
MEEEYVTQRNLCGVDNGWEMDEGIKESVHLGNTTFFT